MAKKNSPQNRGEEKAAAAQRRVARKEKAAAQAAAVEEARLKRQRKERLTVGGVVAGVLALIVFLVWWNVRDTGPVAAPAGVVDEYALAFGEPDAEHTVEVHADFRCPACAQFDAASNGPLSEAAEAGTAYVKFFPIAILGKDSERYANAFAVVLDAAGPEIAKDYHDALFDAQRDGESDRSDDWLVDTAVEAGASESDVREGIEDGAFDDWVSEATDAAAERGVRSTPTIHVDGQVWQNNGDIASLLAMIS